MGDRRARPRAQREVAVTAPRTLPAAPDGRPGTDLLRPPSEERTRRLAGEAKTERQPRGDETASCPRSRRGQASRCAAPAPGTAAQPLASVATVAGSDPGADRHDRRYRGDRDRDPHGDAVPAVRRRVSAGRSGAVRPTAASCRSRRSLDRADPLDREQRGRVLAGDAGAAARERRARGRRSPRSRRASASAPARRASAIRRSAAREGIRRLAA